MTNLSAMQKWETKGQYINVGPLQLKVFVMQIGNPEAQPERTLLLLHGFPESSFSYHAVVEGMAGKFERIILFDFPGFGRSDKPGREYSYSLMEQADVAQLVWKHFGVRGGHLIAHDMGNSIATELAARQVQQLWPAEFDRGLLSFTFTNGSLVIELAKLRITQKILLSRFGHLMKHFTTYKLFRNQIKSAHGNGNLDEQEIRSLWQGNLLQNGHHKAYLTVRYNLERRKFEKSRWLPALAQLKVPVHLCWGRDDAVARVEMVDYLKKNVCPDATATVMEGVGHFGQLGSPEVWVRAVLAFYDRL